MNDMILTVLGDSFGVVLGSFAANALRYAFLAGLVFWLFHIFWARWSAPRKVQPGKQFGRAQISREVKYSISTMVVFAFMDVLIAYLNETGVSQIYFELSLYGWFYLPVSFIAALLVHDAYFYWMHRFMHWGPVYERVHKIHHLSTNPSPWAAFAFHPLEAVLEFGVILVLVLLLPLHVGVLFAFVLWMMLMNVIGHLSVEIYPLRLVRHPIGKMLVTATHHNMHHRTYRFNYGLYFQFWDRVLGTNHPAYDETVARTSHPVGKEATLRSF